MDLADRKVVGWALSENLKAVNTSIAAWRMALKNRAINGKMLFHSTDSHGATDPVFSVSYLLGIDFQPRLAGLHQQKLHGMAGVSMSHSTDYQLAIGEEMDEAVVARQWNRILHLLVSIKLKYTLASLVTKRLNSYALQNPLYQALKEFGKVVRTEFLLRYMNDAQMRHRTHQQQEKIESAHATGKLLHSWNNLTPQP